MKPSRPTIFESFNQAYLGISFSACATGASNPVVSCTLARVSLQLATVSASFMTDTSHFLEAWEGSVIGHDHGRGDGHGRGRSPPKAHHVLSRKYQQGCHRPPPPCKSRCYKQRFRFEMPIAANTDDNLLFHEPLA
ncbi:hypothetical protein CGRA01v4_05086 [Colletotrichum graminicola]|nr:hypothetical protein CGRA01v4_05086 [Colletotrichum graminicola]